MKLRTKFLLQVLLIIVIIFLTVILYINYNYTSFTEKLSFKITELYSQQLAKNIEAKLQGDMKLIEAMKEVLEFYAKKHKTLDQDYVESILEAVLINNPDFLAVWLSVELHFLDKNWLQFHGRKRILAYLDKGQVRFIIDTVDVESEDQNNIYYKSKVGEYKDIIMDPYFYTYSVKDTVSSYLETSLGKPIYYNNEFIGMVGVDIYLGQMRSLIDVTTPFPGSFAVLVSTSGDIVADPNYQNLGKRITSIYPELRQYNVLDSIQQARSFSLIVRSAHSKTLYLYSFTPVVVADPKLPWSLMFVVPINSVLQNARHNLSFSIIISLISIVVVTLLISFFINRVSKKIQRAYEVLSKVSQGVIDEKLKLKVTGKDEIAMMYKAINELIDSLQKTVNFATEIGKGNLDAYYELKSEQDQLGHALIEMKVNLKKIRKEEEERLKQSQKLNWVQQGITEINEILRMQNEDLEQLTFEVIKFIVKYLDAVQGGFYLVEQRDDKKIIRLEVAYAYDRKKLIEAEFEEGEGLIGRAIKEKTIIHINNLPQGYVYVKSGLGDQTPQNLIIVPLIFEDEVYGALEILSFKEFDNYQKEFLSQAAYRIASSVSNIMKSLQTVKLLEEFKQQNKIITEKEAILEKRIRELSALKEEATLLKLKYEKFFEAIGKTVAIVEYNPDFLITKVNDYMLDLLGIQPSDLLGKKIDEIMPEAKENPKWFEKFVSDLKNGLVRKKVTKYSFTNRIVYLDEVYIPIKEGDNLTEIICFGIDITKIKTRETKAKS